MWGGTIVTLDPARSVIGVLSEFVAGFAQESVAIYAKAVRECKIIARPSDNFKKTTINSLRNFFMQQ